MSITHPPAQAPHTPEPDGAQARHGAPSRQKPVTSACPELRYQADAANYIAAMIAELRHISGKAGFEKLVGALDSAYYEAFTLLEPKAAASAQAAEKTVRAMEPSRMEVR